ncbi:LysR family transcriptional regulator [Leucobacter sp. W1153]|uniref:LysR family transcriptional regulator n=1 Tax=Leucobacter sp. W1153 TaxID=3439064 RepID=UPI003F3F7FCE
MELRVIRYFLAAAEAGTVTGGAELVRVSQPAVSRQLAALERELGVQLFDRGHGALKLTHAGRRFAVMANDIVQRSEAARAFVDPGHVQDLRFTVVAQHTTMLHTLAPFTAARGAAHPVIDVIDSAPARVFDTALRQGADIGVSTIPPPAGWAGRRLIEVDVMAFVPPGHPLVRAQSIEMRELTTYPLILMDRSHNARMRFDSALVEAEIPLAAHIEMNSAPMALGHAASGRGVAVLTGAGMFGLEAIPVLLDGSRLCISLYAGWDPTHYAADTIERWVDDYQSWLPTVTGHEGSA